MPKFGSLLISCFILTAWVVSYPNRASACPAVDGLLDFANCNRRVKLIALGDSIVAGVGEDPVRGGFVSRLKSRLPNVNIVNLGIPGLDSVRLLRYLKQTFQGDNTYFDIKSLAKSDHVILSIGVNDYWSGRSAGLTVRNIRRIVNLLRLRLNANVAVTTIVPINRTNQGIFAKEVSRKLVQQNGAALPVLFRFDRIKRDFISADGLHPNAAGYDRLGRLAGSVVSGAMQDLALASRPDVDEDGVFDFFELSKFATDPTNPDSDGDGLSDGEEIFTYKTDPNLQDTDGDGLNDGEEIALGRNPRRAGS